MLATGRRSTATVKEPHVPCFTLNGAGVLVLIFAQLNFYPRVRRLILAESRVSSLFSQRTRLDYILGCWAQKFRISPHGFIKSMTSGFRVF